jgi:subtilase family serine protease
VDIFNQMATENIAKQLSCSWGWNPDDTTQLDPIFQEFAAQGQNLFVASGDAGAYTGSNATDNSYPAESVYVVAVGGTDLTTNGAGGPWQSETAWADSSGGPADDGFAIPSWQTGLANSANQASTTVRNVPDVAAEANTDNYTCDQGTCSGDYGGTSFAAPRWAGFLALVNQQVTSGGKSSLGFLNPVIYSIGQSPSYNNDFHDITSGTNNNGQGQSFNAVVGYDLVTGWGSPNGQSLIDELSGSTMSASRP